jgi:hypothetical protein
MNEAAALDAHAVREVAQPGEIMPLARIKNDPDNDASTLSRVESVQNGGIVSE